MIVAVPEAPIIVWVEPPFIVYETVALGVPLITNSALPTPKQILLSTTVNVATGKALTKTVEEFVRERFLEEEQKKAEQETEYEQYLTLKEKYDS